MQWPVYANNIIIYHTYLDSNRISYLVKSHDDLLPYSLKFLGAKMFKDFCLALKV